LNDAALPRRAVECLSDSGAHSMHKPGRRRLLARKTGGWFSVMEKVNFNGRCAAFARLESLIVSRKSDTKN
jgi:hypothetical protein